jgi:RNA polymerase sigma factor (sigma-70 family)
VNEIPDTRHSLLVRLRDRGDQRAWAELLEIYEPLLYRLARRQGLQHADAEELTQEAFVAVAAAIERWDPDPSRGSFRGWLFRIARNMTINFLSRTRPENVGTGGTGFRYFLEQQPAASAEEVTLFGREYRREAFRWAAGEIREEFQESTWRAFWATAVEGRDIKETAGALEMSLGAVYAARSRIMARLKRKLQQLEGRYASPVEER